MIVDSIINLAFDFINSIIDTLNISSFSIDTSYLTSFLNVLGNVAYFLPWPYIVPIFGYIAIMQAYRIVVSILKLIVGFIPFY